MGRYMRTQKKSILWRCKHLYINRTLYVLSPLYKAQLAPYLSRKDRTSRFIILPLVQIGKNPISIIVFIVAVISKKCSSPSQQKGHCRFFYRSLSHLIQIALLACHIIYHVAPYYMTTVLGFRFLWGNTCKQVCFISSSFDKNQTKFVNIYEMEYFFFFFKAHLW